jgi:hypothetical protein
MTTFDDIPKNTPSFQSLVFDWDILKLVAEYCGAARFACLPQNCTMDGCGGSLRHDRLRYTRIEKKVNKISRFVMCPTVIKVYLFVSNSTVAIGSSSHFLMKSEIKDNTVYFLKVFTSAVRG